MHIPYWMSELYITTFACGREAGVQKGHPSSFHAVQYRTEPKAGRSGPPGFLGNPREHPEFKFPLREMSASSTVPSPHPKRPRRIRRFLLYEQSPLLLIEKCMRFSTGHQLRGP